MWWIGPWIVRHIFKIRWIDYEELDPDIKKFIENICLEHKIKIPRFGIIEDDNPNAFCFGRTRDDAYLVLTRGIDKYCNKEEKIAVIGHEMGHIVHNDFIVMTTITAIPIIFYTIYKGCIDSMRYSRGGNDKSKGFIVIIALIALVAYLITEFIVLLVSRYREYWADRFSAKTTLKPNSLSMALVKIAYGLANEGKGREKKKQTKLENALMISNPESGRSLAFNVGALKVKSKFTNEDIKEAMAWDMWNPWAAWLEFQSTHPLPAKRIMVLDKLAEDFKQTPAVGFNLVKPESFWDEFIGDVAAAYFWLIAFPVGFCIMFWINFVAGLGAMIAIIGVSLALYLLYYRYPMGFRRRTVEYCIDDPKASPIRGTPVELEGKIIGRGVPGLFFNEDLKLDDGTGLMLLDYHQVAKIVDLIEGIFYTEKKFGRIAKIKGWYRRSVTPYVEIYTIEWEDKRKKMWTRPAYVALAVAFGIFGLALQVFMPYTYIFTFISLIVLAGFMIILKNKYSRWEEERQVHPEHPYLHLSSIKDAALVYNVLDYCTTIEPDGTTIKPGCKAVSCPRCGTIQEISLDKDGRYIRCKGCYMEGIINFA
jgi:heat shock protein HtpX